MRVGLSASGFVLAGGRSSRMGSDKALALFAGMPLIQVALNVLAEAGVPARIAGSRSVLGAYAQEIADTFAECGPMGGVHAGLAASDAEWSLFLPVDLPLIPGSLLSRLLERAVLTGAPVTATRLNGHLEPFPVVLGGNVLPLLTQQLESGETACYRAWQSISRELGDRLDAVDVEGMVQCGQCRHPDGLPPVLWFRSANTPEELMRLNRIYAKLRAPIAASLK